MSDTAYPGGLDTWATPKRDGVPLLTLLSELTAAVQALQAKVGVDNSVVRTSLDSQAASGGGSSPDAADRLDRIEMALLFLGVDIHDSSFSG